MNIMIGLASVFSKFKSKTVTKDEYLSCEEYFLKEILRAITKENFINQETAMGTGNQLVGLKFALSKLKQNYEEAEEARKVL